MKLSNQELNLNYGIGKVFGVPSMDSITFATNETVRNQTFLTVLANENLDNLKADGIMVFTTQGLSRHFESSAPYQVSLVQAFYMQGLIDSQVFSIFLNNNEFGDTAALPASALLLGGYDLKTYSQSSNFTYIPLRKVEGFWAVNMSKIAVGEIEFQLESNYAIMDTGSSYILAPSFDAYQILEVIKEVGKCAQGKERYVCECDSSEWAAYYPTIVLMLGPDEVAVPLYPQDYFFRVRTIQSEGRCQLLIDTDPQLTFWILGDVFVRKYYIMFDVENEVIGLAPSILSYVKVHYENNWPAWARVFGFPVIGGLVFLVAYSILEYSWKKQPHLSELVAVQPSQD